MRTVGPSAVGDRETLIISTQLVPQVPQAGVLLQQFLNGEHCNGCFKDHISQVIIIHGSKYIQKTSHAAVLPMWIQ